MISSVLYILDSYTSLLYYARLGLSTAVSPIHYTLDWSVQQVGWLITGASQYRNALKENEMMRKESLQLTQELIQYKALVQENEQLRELWQSAKIITTSKKELAEVLAVSGEPYVQWFTLNKGQVHGIEEALPVLDADGVVGQVVAVKPAMSDVMLITNPRSAVPVQNQRTLNRSIAVGFDHKRLALLHIPSNQDVQVGDLYVTSGLGDTFPFGYPVGEVIHVNRDTGTGFAEIYLIPKAQFNRTRFVVIIQSISREEKA